MPHGTQSKRAIFSIPMVFPGRMSGAAEPLSLVFIDLS